MRLVVVIREWINSKLVFNCRCKFYVINGLDQFLSDRNLVAILIWTNCCVYMYKMLERFKYGFGCLVDLILTNQFKKFDIFQPRVLMPLYNTKLY